MTSQFVYSENGSVTSGGSDSSGSSEYDESDLEFPENVQYSSSSFDRSSIGSIPWADDAIKQNQFDWERVDRMFHGEEDLTGDPELRNEILEWHKKFPQLLHQDKLLRPKYGNKTTVIDLKESLDLNSISNLSFDSEEDEDGDGFVTPTNSIAPTNKRSLYNSASRQCFRHSANSLQPLTQQTVNAHEQLITMLDRDLRITSIPMTTRHRGMGIDSMRRQPEVNIQFESTPANPTKYKKSSLLYVPESPPLSKTAKKGSNSATAAIRMPPILNMLTTKRRFRGLTTNPSFVQLTQIQAQSTATASQREGGATSAGRHSWNSIAADVPTFNHAMNKNSITLPAINLQRIHKSLPVTTTESSNKRNLNSLMISRNERNRQQFLGTTGSTFGRSISAAHHRQLNAFYLPYSATKFKMFK